MRAFVAVSVCVLAAGCFGGPDAPAPGPEAADDDDPLTDGARDLRTQLWANDTLGAPQWNLGDWWTYETTVPRPLGGGTFQTTTVVSERVGSAWNLRSDDPDVAVWEAIFDRPILGTVADGTLTTNYYGEVWTWYQFPLTDGATWQATVGRLEDPFQELVDAFWGGGPPASYDLTYNATYADAIPTPLGERPGFRVAATADSQTLITYDYVPAIGWFTDYREYRNGGGPDDWTLRMAITDAGHNFTGTLYDAQASPTGHLLFVAGAYPDGDPTDPTGLQPEVLFTGNAPTQDFAVDGDALFGYLLAGAAAGASEVRVLDGANQQRAQASAAGTPPGFVAFDAPQVAIDDPVAGTWRTVVAGGGPIFGGGSWLWDVTRNETPMAT